MNQAHELHLSFNTPFSESDDEMSHIEGGQ